MIRATKVFAKDRWSHAASDTVVLDFDARHRRRVAMRGTRGLEFLLDLPDAVALRDGDGLLLEDGRIVEVQAAPEPLAEVTGKDPEHLLRLAWHIGNRHLPAELAAGRILIRRDHVIEDMLAGLGAKVVAIQAPFNPEGGAYAGGESHSHARSESHSHARSESHSHAHSHSHDHDDDGHGHKHG